MKEIIERYKKGELTCYEWLGNEMRENGDHCVADRIIVKSSQLDKEIAAMEKQPTEYEYVEITEEYAEAWNCLKDFVENVELHTKDDGGNFHKIGGAKVCLDAWIKDKIYRRIELTPEQLHERKVEDLAEVICRSDGDVWSSISKFDKEDYRKNAKAALEWMESKGK